MNTPWLLRLVPPAAAAAIAALVILCGVTVLPVPAPGATEAEPPAARAAVGEVVFRADFTAADAVRDWQWSDRRGVALVRHSSGRQMLLIEQAAENASGSNVIRHRLPVERLRGTKIRVRCRAWAEAVSKPPKPWNGVKCMIHTNGSAGPRWTQEHNVWGDFADRRLAFVAEVPQDATEAYLVLGLEAVSGKVWFDDIVIQVAAVQRRRPAHPPTGPVFKGHNMPRLRGAMIGTKVDTQDLEVLAGWGANHVRWQLIWGGFPHGPADKADVNSYDAWLETELQRLDRLLPVCQRLGIHVAIDLHTPPGGRAPDKHCRIFSDRAMQEHFVVVWRRIAERYKNKPAVWGYDLVNEPVEPAEPGGLLDWRSLAIKTAKEIRHIDPHRAIIIEPAPWGSIAALEWLEPIDVPGVVYSVHMYEPFAFTHQGVRDMPIGVRYPGTIGGTYWDKEQLRKVLQPAVEYQKDYNVHIYIGEFSAIRWAPDNSAERYLRDCIELFEQYGWDWAYHAFREWDGWSVEHGPDRNDRKPAAQPTGRQLLLQEWFRKR